MPDQKQSILLGSAICALLSTSYLGFVNMCCCAGIIAGAMVTVWHYTNTHSVTIAPGKGAVMGVLVAVIGGIIATVLNLLLDAIGLGMQEAIQGALLDFYREQMPPEQFEQMEEQMTAQQSVGVQLLYGLLGVVVYAIFGAIGGAIGASIFKKGDETSGMTGTVGTV